MPPQRTFLPLPRVAPVVAVVLALGCGDSLAPSDVAGVYVLRAVGGEPLPAVLFSNEDVTVRVFADTLRLDADGRGTQVTVAEVEYKVDGSRSGPERGGSDFAFRTVGGRVEISYPCPINANCAPPPHLVGRRFGGALLVRGRNSLVREELYDRIDAER